MVSRLQKNYMLTEILSIIIYIYCEVIKEIYMYCEVIYIYCEVVEEIARLLRRFRGYLYILRSCRGDCEVIEEICYDIDIDSYLLIII